MSAFILSGFTIAVLTVVQAEDGVIIKVFNISRGISFRARCRGNINRRSDFVKPIKLINDVI
jgi:hypothetical protein